MLVVNRLLTFNFNHLRERDQCKNKGDAYLEKEVSRRKPFVRSNTFDCCCYEEVQQRGFMEPLNT